MRKDEIIAIIVKTDCLKGASARLIVKTIESRSIE